MPYSISADFLLGVYQGHDRRGHAEEYPDIARLQAAFISAAYALNAYKEEDGNIVECESGLGLPDNMAAAIEWLESNPPDAISLPAAARTETTGISAFRNKGLASKSKDKGKTQETALSRVSFEGSLVWWWNEAPDEAICRAFELLSPEIPYLGEAASPVRIATCTEDSIPREVWTRAEGLGLDNIGYPTFGVPHRGRAEALQTAFTAGVKQKVPSAAKDACKSNEDEISDYWNDGLIDKAVYRFALDDVEATEAVPWAYGYILDVAGNGKETHWPPTEDEYIRWAIALHRALVNKCGNDVPLLLTGKGTRASRETIQLPANGVSIQIVDPSLPLDDDASIDKPAFLVMIPSGADLEEVESVDQAVGALRKVFDGKLGAVSVTNARTVDLTRFWKAPEEGTTRWWQPRPLYVADNRPPYRNSSNREPWTLADTIRVSIGYVWRDELSPLEKSGKRQAELSRLVDEQGVVVVGERLLYPERMEKYVYHMNRGSFLTAATAWIWLGDLSSDCSAIAIGQTRHLGGGLLVPVDLPDDVAKLRNERKTGRESQDDE